MKAKVLGGVLVVGTVLLAVGMHTRILTALGSHLVESDAIEKADTVLVLDGDASGRRILRAADLVRDGYAPQVLVSGSAGVFGMYSCDLAIPYAVKKGYPESYFVHLESVSHSTEDEAQAALAMIRKRGYRKVLLVTSNYHTHRAVAIYRKQAPDLTFIAVPAPDENFTPSGWWHNRESRKTFLIEWEKTAAGWLGV